MNQILNQGVTHDNIKSWCQKFLDFLDLSFAELISGITWNIWEISIISLVCALQMDISPLFLSNEGGNRWTIDGFYGIFQIFP